MKRRELLAGLSAAPAVQWPRQAITLVVPFAAGGPSDASARYIGRELEKALGQAVVIENIGGAAGSIGIGKLARSAPSSAWAIPAPSRSTPISSPTSPMTR